MTNPNATSEEGGSDELGPALEEGEGDGDAGELPWNECLLQPDGRYGYRHHCGGFMTFGFSGEANGHSIAQSYSYGFGPDYVDPEFEDLDTYATPVVMACCGGPYDFDQAPSSQPTYFQNCKADATQQMCAAMGQWLIKLAEKYPLAKKELYEAAKILGSQSKQTACFLALHEVGENFNEVTDTAWKIGVGKSWLTIEIDRIEILNIAYDEPSLTCESVFENDEYLLPLLTQMLGRDLHVVALHDGNITLTNGTFKHSTTPIDGYMSIGTFDDDEKVELRNLVFRDPDPVTLIVDSASYTIDSWNLALIGPVSAVFHSNVATFPAGAVSFAMSVSHEGRLYRAGGTNVRPLELTSTDGEWHVDGLELTFPDGATTWSLYNSSTLVFGP